MSRISGVRLVTQAVATLIDRDTAKIIPQVEHNGVPHRGIRRDTVQENRKRAASDFADVQRDRASVDPTR
jgi:hypothetical protein